MTMLTVCAACGYILRETDTRRESVGYSHGIGPVCCDRLYPGLGKCKEGAK